MTTKKKLKTHQGKDRIYSAIPSAPNISRVLVWNCEKGEYLPPTRGKTFFARKYEFKNGKKVRETCYCESLEEARAWQQSSPLQPTPGATLVAGTSTALHEVIERWKKEEWPNLKENTKIQYEKCLSFYDSILGLPIEDIKPFVIDNLISEWRKDLKKYKSIRTSFKKELETLTYIFNWYQGNYDEASLAIPFKDRHFRRIQIKESKQATRKFMTDDEASSFLAEIKKEGSVFYALALTQIRQMMRISEVCAMKWKNLNFKNRSYTLCEHMIWPRIGGALPYIGAGTKNVKGGEGFELNLFREVAEALREIPKHPGCDLIFHHNGEMLTYRQVQYRFDKSFARAGLPFRSTHVLRHSGATSFYNASGDLLALQQMGTWSNSRMPQHYAKVMSTKAKDAIEKMESRSHLRVVNKE
jgi:integrase